MLASAVHPANQCYEATVSLICLDLPVTNFQQLQVTVTVCFKPMSAVMRDM